MSASHAQTQIRRHPIRGGLYGLLLGIGVSVYLVIFAVTPFSVSTSIIVLVACVLLGTAWGAFAPAKQPDVAPPSRTSFGSTFSRSADAEGEAAESYESTFGSATGDDAVPSESVFGTQPEQGQPPTEA